MVKGKKISSLSPRLTKSSMQRVLERIDKDELIDLAEKLCDIPSPTGSEKQIAEFILQWLQACGFETIRQDVELDRPNAIGILRGTGGGCSLTFNGHLDIAVMEAGEPIKEAFAKDGKVYGEGVTNMKGSIAAFLIAGKAIKESGIRLQGDLILAGVIGEISTCPVGEFQGACDRGEGLGTRHLLSHGVYSDYAVVTDGSEFAVITAQAGVAGIKITTEGPMLYTPFTRRTRRPRDSQNAIIRALKIVELLEQWGNGFEKRNKYHFRNGVVEPKVSVCAVEAGIPKAARAAGERLPFRPSTTPSSCSLYVDVRLPPGKNPLDVKVEICEVLAKSGIDAKVEMFRSQLGYEGKGKEVDELFTVVRDAYETVTGEKPPGADAWTSSMWTDTNLYWEVGIPAVKFGTPQHKSPEQSTLRVVDIEDLVKTAQINALIALEVCNWRSQPKTR